MTSGIETEVHRLAADWEDLAERTGAGPFMHPGFITAWHAGFGEGPLELLTVRRNGRVVALLPLQRCARTLRAPSNWDTPTFGPLAEDAAALGELARALWSVTGVRRVSLGFLQAGTEAAAVLRQVAERSGWRVRETTLQRSPYLPLDGGWEEYELGFPSKRRSNLRRLRKRLEERGTLTLQVEEGPERLGELLEEGFAVEASGWKGESGTAIASSPGTRRYYVQAAHWAAQRGLLRLAFLRLDGRPLAFDFAFEDGTAHYLIRTGYDPAFRSFAPGVVMRREMIARAFRLGLARYEFLGAEAPWKHEWTERVRAFVMLEAFARSPAGTSSWVIWRYARPAVHRARAAVSRS